MTISYYPVNYTDSLNNPPLIVEDNTINVETSLNFPGRNTTGYGQIIAENFLHLLENFANTEQPSNAVQGQLWYDTSTGVLNVYDGALWTASGGLKKGREEPAATSSLPGDLWVNTDTQQLYLFTGSGWILVGPRFSSGSRTGAEPESIIDNGDAPRTVVSQYVEGERIAIISKETFVPKSTIFGFPTIYAGVTLHSSYNTYYGTAEKSNALVVNGQPVASSNFLRSDVTSTTNFPFNVKNATGLAVGPDNQLTLSIDGTTGALTHRTSGSSINIRVNNNGLITTVVNIDSSSKVGINNNTPQEVLDVNGNILASGTIKTTNDTQSTSATTGAITLAGGLGVAKNLNVGGNFRVSGDLTVTTAILPDEDLGANLGTSLLKFNRIWASRFDGEFHGDLKDGTVYGNVTGSASKLASATSFSLDGDIVSDIVEFDGQTGGTTKVFNTELNPLFVSNKTEITAVGENDEFLISQTTGLRKIKKSNLWNSIVGIPIGGMMPFAGTTPPAGWLLCDGSEVRTSIYPALFSVVGYSYGDINTLQGLGTFKLPDLRSRFPMGLDNMNNGITVPRKTDPTTTYQRPTPANRISDPEASILGGSSGNDQIAINVENLPDHEHDMIGDAGNQYYAFRNISGTPTDSGALSGQGSLTSNLGQYLASSGGIKLPGGVTTLGTDLNILNPFLGVNFIIYAGV